MVVDASVVASRLVPHDVHHETTRRWLTRHVEGGGLLVVPALLLPEVAGAVARRTGDPRLARRAVDAVLRVPGLRLVPVDEVLARMAAGLAGRLRVRGADAVYVALAAALRLPLVTWDVEQCDRAARLVPVLTPATPERSAVFRPIEVGLGVLRREEAAREWSRSAAARRSRPRDAET